jgi:hypothetical protein
MAGTSPAMTKPARCTDDRGDIVADGFASLVHQ